MPTAKRGGRNERSPFNAGRKSRSRRKALLGLFRLGLDDPPQLLCPRFYDLPLLRQAVAMDVAERHNWCSRACRPRPGHALALERVSERD